MYSVLLMFFRPTRRMECQLDSGLPGGGGGARYALLRLAAPCCASLRLVAPRCASLRRLRASHRAAPHRAAASRLPAPCGAHCAAPRSLAAAGAPDFTASHDCALFHREIHPSPRPDPALRGMQPAMNNGATTKAAGGQPRRRRVHHGDSDSSASVRWAAALRCPSPSIPHWH